MKMLKNQSRAKGRVVQVLPVPNQDIRTNEFWDKYSFPSYARVIFSPLGPQAANLRKRTKGGIISSIGLIFTLLRG